MKAGNIKTLSEFLRYCKMPIYFKAEIKKMRMGDTFFMGKIPSKYFCINGVCEAWIKKSRGKFTFYSTFTFLTKKNRPLIINHGDFTLKKGDLIIFSEDNCDVRNINLFGLVCRYLSFFYRNLSTDEWDDLYRKGATPLFYGVLLDSKFITRTGRLFKVNGKHERLRVNCEDYQPEHQLMAIVEAGIKTGNIRPH